MSGDADMTPEARRRVREQDEFEGYVRDYVAYLKGVRNLSDNTARSYAADLASYVSWVRREGVLPLDVSHRELRSYLAELTRAGYDASTMDRHLSAIRGLYRWLEREGHEVSNAASAIASPKAARKLPHTMSDEDVRALLATCEENTAVGLRDRAFLELLYATGARISEMSALKVGDVDLSAQQARLFGKGSKERIVPVYEVALDWTRRYLDEARPSLAMARKGEPADALLLSTRGNPMSAEALRRRFERHVELAGLDPTLTPHAMRHTYATELLSGGADLRSVQELLGHESLSTTQIYTHLSVDRLKDATRSAHPRSQG